MGDLHESVSTHGLPLFPDRRDQAQTPFSPLVGPTLRSSHFLDNSHNAVGGYSNKGGRAPGHKTLKAWEDTDDSFRQVAHDLRPACNNRFDRVNREGARPLLLRFLRAEATMHETTIRHVTISANNSIIGPRMRDHCCAPTIRTIWKETKPQLLFRGDSRIYFTRILYPLFYHSRNADRNSWTTC